MEQIKSDILRRFSTDAQMNSDLRYYEYQIDCLLNEVEYAQRSRNILRPRNTFVSKFLEHSSIGFVRRHLQQFYWTITRLIGLGYLHDGSRWAKRSRPLLARAQPVLAQDHVEMSAGPRVLIDVTITHRNNHKTGIPRVAREIAKAAIANGSALPVVIENGRLVSYFRHPDLPDVVEIRRGDRYLLLDAGWCIPDEYEAILNEVSRCGGSNICCIYDLVPLLYRGVAEPASRKIFRDWLKICLSHCDAVVTISNSVAEDFKNYVSANKLSCKPSLRVGWFHLGADFAVEAEKAVSKQVQDICTKAPFFVTVGTIEPRKNHAVALAAFDLIWNAGVDVQYVIVGRSGWLVHALRDRILRHPEFGRRLFWLEHAEDTDLHFLYRHATALIQPSIAEGFGLPIVEAAHFGTPVIASDIRIFREIGGESISYFDPMDPQALAMRIQEALIAPRVAPSITPLSWKEATERLLRLVKDETYPYMLKPIQFS